MKKTTITNTIKLLFFCALAGAAAGLVLWAFLRVVYLGTELLWTFIPEKSGEPVWYPLAVCTAGGIIIGIFRKAFGDYPETMDAVMLKVKAEGTYPYNNIVVLMVAAILPLIFGSSVGPEAGMVGAIVAISFWVKDNVKHASRNAALYSDIGMAVSLSILFYSPLFGFFSAVEDNEDISRDDGEGMDKGRKILLFGIAISTAFGIMCLLNEIFGQAMSGLPRFDAVSVNRWDLLMGIPYLLCGMLLGVFFEMTEKLFVLISGHLPAVLKESIAGLVLGGCVIFVPALAFSGEEEMGELAEHFGEYMPVAILLMAFAKVLITNMCIQLGLKGGHFFPLIFAAVCMGFGLSLLVFPGSLEHAAFGGAIATAGTMGITMKKPMAITCLLLLCFPVKVIPCIFIASILASSVTKIGKGSKQ